MQEREDKHIYEDYNFDLESYLSQIEVENAIPKNGILILPNENWRQSGKPVYMPETYRFVKWVKQTDVVQSEINLVELKKSNVASLRSDEIWLPIAYVFSDASFQIFLNVAASYLYDKLKGLLKNEDMTVHLEILKEDKLAKKVKRFLYDGSYAGLKEIIKKIDVNEFME